MPLKIFNEGCISAIAHGKNCISIACSNCRASEVPIDVANGAFYLLRKVDGPGVYSTIGRFPSDVMSSCCTALFASSASARCLAFQIQLLRDDVLFQQVYKVLGTGI